MTRRLPLSTHSALRQANSLSLIIALMISGVAAAQEPRRMTDAVAEEATTEMRADQLTGRPDR